MKKWIFFFFLLPTLGFGKPPWLLERKGTNFTLDRKKLHATFGKTPAKILGPVKFKIVPTTSKDIHFEITELQQGNALEPLGIQKGDVLKTVNGQGVSLDLFLSPKQAPAEWQDKKRYVLKFDRAGKEISHVYHVK
jgi:hypothetical protein